MRGFRSSVGVERNSCSLRQRDELRSGSKDDFLESKRFEPKINKMDPLFPQSR